MAAPTYVDSTPAGVNGTTLNIAAPTGLQAGDLLIAVGGCYSNYTLNDPTGGAGTAWTTLGTRSVFGGANGLWTRAWYRYAAAGDIGATFTVTATGSESYSVVITAYRGVHTSSPINAWGSTGDNDTNLTASPATVTTTVADCAILYFLATEWESSSGGSLSWSAGPTAREYQNTGGVNSLGYADEVKATAGTTTVRTGTYAAGTGPSVGEWTIALAPASTPIEVTVNQVTETDLSQPISLIGPRAPAYVGSSKAGANNLSVNVVAPVGIVAGDRLLIMASTWSSRTLGTDPTGGAGTAWTTVADVTNTGGSFGVRSKLWHRVATAADIGATFTVTQAGGSAVGMSVVMAVYRRARVTSVINAYATNGGSGLARVGPTLTTTVDDAMLLLFDAAEWGTASAGNLSWSAGTSRQYQVTDGGFNSLGFAELVKATAGLTSAVTSTHDAGSSPTKTAWQVALAPAYFIPVGQAVETDEAQPVTRKGYISVSQVWTIPEVAQPIVARRNYPVGQVSETELAQPVGKTKRKALSFLDEGQIPQPIAVGFPYNGSFANREDLSEDFWAVPTQNLLMANTEAGEYTSSLVATVWWEWTTPLTVPTSITVSFPWSGQSGAGGGSVRIYQPTTPGVIPPSGDIVSQHNPTGAAGTASVTFTPLASTTYYFQQGIREKTGTVGHLDLTISWVAAPTFTPVIP